MFVDHDVKQAGREPEAIDALGKQHVTERTDRRHTVGKYHQLGTMEQRAPHLESRCIERQRRHLEKRRGPLPVDEVRTKHQTQHTTMRDTDTVWASSRIRHVHHIRQILSTNVIEDRFARTVLEQPHLFV